VRNDISESALDTAVILVVDDSKLTLAVVERMMERVRWEVLTAHNAAMALDLAETADIDLFLLDINLPDRSGFELCRRLKSIDKFKDTPIIFFTCQSDEDSILEGFSLGGVDYIIKPFKRAELIARLKLHLELSRRRQICDNYAVRMEKLAEDRAEQLLHAERMATLGLLAAGIAHEINNPLTFITGNMKPLETFWETVATAMQSCPHPADQHKEKVKFVVEEMPKLISDIRKGASRIASIVKGLKTYARKERHAVMPIEINEPVEQALGLCRNSLKRVTVRKELHMPSLRIRGHSQQVEQVLVNLFINAADATADIEDAVVTVKTYREDGCVCIDVVDNGSGVPRDFVEKIWEPFFTTKSEQQGTGLGLAISRGIVEEYDGTLTVSNNPGGGACFSMKFSVPGEDGKNTTGSG